MANERIVEEIKKSGMKKSAIASKLGISNACLNNKLNGKSDFFVAESISLLRILGYSEKDFAHFFAN